MMDYLPFDTPGMFHAAMVHGPVCLSILSLCGLVLSMFLRKNLTLRWLTVTLYFLLLVAACIAVIAGEAAAGVVPNTFPQATWDQIELHEELGELLRIVCAVTFALVAASFVASRQSAWRHIIWLALLGGLACTGMTGFTAHLGGSLVYKHGVGIPAAPSMDPIEIPATHSVAPEPAPEPETVAAPEPTYTADIQPLFAAHCTECHGGDSPAGGLNLETREGLLTGGRKAGPAVIAGSPDDSPLVQYLEGTRQPQMPRRAPALDTETIGIVRTWIAGGLN